MALQLSLQFPILLYPKAPSPTTSSSSSYPQIKLTPKPIIKHSTTITRTTQRKITQFTIKATTTDEENPQAANNDDDEPQTVITQQSSPNEPQPQPTNSATGDLSELGSEIKMAMKERDGGGGGNLWSGVAEEIREIEWPAFGKVVGITGVVLGVIAGSSVVLLTVNAVLAELSDRVFAGKGVQDFFG